MTNSIVTIKQTGDLLERMMFSDEEFAGQFSLYPEVWARCILPNRRSGTIAFASPEWSQFAERHYTTIVRCWNARGAERDVLKHCQSTIENPDAHSYIQLHKALFDFFCLCGAVVDNMEATFAATPIRSADVFQQVKERQGKQFNLRWFYDRRTQFVHKAIVPCFEVAGSIAFDLTIFQDPETRWEVSGKSDFDSIETYISLLWTSFVEEMTAAWSELLRVARSVKIDHARNPNLPKATPFVRSDFSFVRDPLANDKPILPENSDPIIPGSGDPTVLGNGNPLSVSWP